MALLLCFNSSQLWNPYHYEKMPAGLQSLVLATFQVLPTLSQITFFIPILIKLNATVRPIELPLLLNCVFALIYSWALITWIYLVASSKDLPSPPCSEQPPTFSNSADHSSIDFFGLIIYFFQVTKLNFKLYESCGFPLYLIIVITTSVFNA